MLEFKGIDHVKAAFKRKFTDRVPVYPICGIVTANLFGASTVKYLQDPDTIVDCQMKMYDRIKPDVVVMMADLLMEVEALGTKLLFPEGQLCRVERFLLGEDKNLDVLALPDPERDGRMPYYLEACEKMSKQVHDAAVGAVISGPWTVAFELREAKNIILDTFKDPAYVHELMTFTTDLVKQFGLALNKKGVGISLSEAPASCSICSPDIYRNFIKPYHSELVEFFKSQKAGLTLHICGKIEPMIEDILETGAAAVSFDALTSMEKMLALSGGRTVLIGNVATDLFTDPDTGKMEAAVKKCIDIAAADSAFILSSGCEIPPDSKMENIECFIRTAHAYGRYQK
jgi:uroporphyrinogen decarboxylase